MIAYRYNPTTAIYAGTQECQLDPLESEIAGKDIYLLPANCTFDAPLEAKDGYDIVFNDGAWEYIAIPVEKEPTEPELTEAQKFEQEISSQKAYLRDTDYCVIKIAEGVATQEEYNDVLVKRAETRETINKLQEELDKLNATE